MWIETFRVVWTGAGEVAYFVTDEALGVWVLPLGNVGLALL